MAFRPARPRLARLLERGLLLGAAVFLLGEDVERAPQTLTPPRPAPRKTQPAEQAPVPAPAESPAGPRYPFLGPGPRRLDLTPPCPEDERHPEEREAERVARALAGALEAQLARGRVERGRADPAWFELARRMETFFRPDFSQVRDPRISEVSGAWLAETGRRYLLDDPRGLAERGNQAVVSALIEVRFGPGGESEARLVEGSGSRLFDEHALSAARDALEHPRGDAPPPPDTRALLAFQGRYTIIPPAPILGLVFDECTGSVDLIHPFKKVVSGAIFVVAVHGPEPEAGAAPRPAPPPAR